MDSPANIVWILASVFAVWTLFELVYFVWLPQSAIQRYQSTDRERLRRYLEWVVATPSTQGEAMKLVARTALSPIYLHGGEPAKAEAHDRAILATLARNRKPNRSRSLEADTRRRLADSLEALGQPDEAQAQRLAAEECVDLSTDDRLRQLTRAKLLQQQDRHVEAIEAFEQALALTPKSDFDARALCMAHLVLACYNAGRPQETLRWAEEVLNYGGSPLILRSAHKMAGITLGNWSRFDEAEEHFRQAIELAQAEKKTKEVAEILALLAAVQRKRGKLAEAYAACDEAARIDPKAIRHVNAVKAEILVDWGRFDEALELLRHHDEGPKLAIVAGERRIRAVSAMTRARIEAVSGRADDAWVHVQQAITELGSDAKLGLICDAVAALVLAARGLLDDSRRVADDAEGRLPEFDQSPGTQRPILHDLGKAAWIRRDFDEAEQLWTRFLDLDPHPINRPTAHYFRGECRRELGNIAGARADYDAALALEIDSDHARLARSRRGHLSML